MMSSEDTALEALLYGGLRGDEVDGAEPGRSQGGEEEEEQEEQEEEEDQEEQEEQEEQKEESAVAATSLPAPPGEEPMVCGGCDKQVCDRFFLLAAGRVWHGACLRCNQCHRELQTHPSLYWREGSIYCQQDYCRLFGIGRCTRCSEPIPSSAMVMRSGELTFHPQCFSCQECDVLLTPGNLYCMQGQNLYCQSHYHDHTNVPLPLNPHLKPNLAEDGEESVSSPELPLDDSIPIRRTKRIRTCFRSEQLRALESYFVQKHNPDGKDWTCLAHKTGLPKRVLQVWFQNARAKLRRSLSADDSQSNSPAAPSRSEATVATSPPQTCSAGLSRTFHASTIDQLELSLLTAPLGNLPQSPAVDRSQGLKDSFFLDYDSQAAPGYASPLVGYGDFGESGDGVESDGNSDVSLRTYYC